MSAFYPRKRISDLVSQLKCVRIVCSEVSKLEVGCVDREPKMDRALVSECGTRSSPGKEQNTLTFFHEFSPAFHSHLVSNYQRESNVISSWKKHQKRNGTQHVHKKNTSLLGDVMLLMMIMVTIELYFAPFHSSKKSSYKAATNAFFIRLGFLLLFIIPCLCVCKHDDEIRCEHLFHLTPT